MFQLLIGLIINLIGGEFKFNWVLRKELAVGNFPKNNECLDFLESQGINAILTLCRFEEAGIEKNLKSRFKHVYYPLPDHSYKEKMKIDQLLYSLKKLAELKKYGSVYVHCLAGVERSPLICMAWLVKYRDFAAIEALDYLMQVNEGTNPLPSQFKLLNKFLLSKS